MPVLSERLTTFCTRAPWHIDALVEIAHPMRGAGGAAAVTQHKNAAALPVCAVQRLGKRVQLCGIQCVQHAAQLGKKYSFEKLPSSIYPYLFSAFRPSCCTS